MINDPPVTMKDIAEKFGVSVATVSRALGGNTRISAERREAIQAYAKEHHFVPNFIAESLRHSRTKTQKIIGVIVPEVTHYYFASILTGITCEAATRGYQIMLAISEEKYANELRICQQMAIYKVCGVIVSQAKDTQQYDHFRRLMDKGIPMVFYDRICIGIDSNRVVVDDYMGAFTAVSHLINTGCRRIAFYSSPMNMEISKNRYNGYRDALLKFGIKPDDSLIRYCDNRIAAEAVTPEMLERADRPDAFFAVNDDTAIGILYVAKRMGFKVPEEISICGFTNGVRAVSCDPMLTTVEQRGVAVGKEAADMLINKVEGITPMDKVEKRVVRTRLILRGTTRN